MMEPMPANGRPSAAHEARVRTLATLATLAGHVVEIDALPDGGRPDVLLVRPGDHSVFIGDAKATETPGNAETAQRLVRYTAFLRAYVRAGGSGVVALAVPTQDPYGWLRVLRDVCTRLGDGRVEGKVDVLAVDCAVVWQRFSGMREQGVHTGNGRKTTRSGSRPPLPSLRPKGTQAMLG